MFRILLAEDEETNSKILSFYLKEYLDNHDIKDYVIEVASNGYEALGMLEMIDFDVLFLDVMMPKLNGFRVLTQVRKKHKHQPYICMVTSLGEEKHKFLFKLNKANSYIIKPFDKSIVINVFDKIFHLTQQDNKNLENSQQDYQQDNEFLDFDDEFDDFYDFSDNDIQDITDANITHKKISAKQFLEDYNNLSHILDDVAEIDDALTHLIDSLDIDTFEMLKNEMLDVFEIYISFVNSFLDFNELSNAIYTISTIIDNLNINSYNIQSQTYIIEFIRAILSDISNWKEHVFVKQDAVDVFYINASVINSYVQLKGITDAKA